MLRGQFATMAIADVLDWVGRRQISGRLMVDDGQGVTRIFRLEAGAVVWATSTEPTESLGQLLRGAGHVDDQLLAAALADEVTPGPLGTRLVEHGAVAESTLRAILQVKIREALWDLHTWRDGRFDVETGALTASPGVRVAVSVGDVQALVTRRAPRWPAIRAVLASDDVGFAEGAGVAPAAANLPFDDGRLLAAAVTGLPVRALVAAMGGHRFAVLDRLAALVESGALVVAEATAVEPDVDALVKLAEQRAAAAAWAGALAVASEALAAAPDDGVVAALYRRVERARVGALARALLAPPRVPELRRTPDELAASELTDVERALLHAVDGRWDLLTLIDHAPVRSAEALLVYARLAERGIVELTLMAVVEPGPAAAPMADDPDPAPTPLALLPRSGIGVDGSDLVIAPRGNPIIRLDARLLDRVALVGRSSATQVMTAGAATIGAVAGLLAFLPGGVITGLALGLLAYERGVEAHRRAQTRELLLGLGALEVVLHVVDGPAAAKRIADQLAPYTRTAPISRADVYEDARRRLAAAAAGTGPRAAQRELARALAVGDEAVQVVGDFLQIGTIGFRLEEVRDAARGAANLALPGGRFVQAALCLLVVVAEERAKQGEDLEALAKRISDYEAWSGRTAGR